MHGFNYIYYSLINFTCVSVEKIWNYSSSINLVEITVHLVELLEVNSKPVFTFGIRDVVETLEP